MVHMRYDPIYTTHALLVCQLIVCYHRRCSSSNKCLRGIHYPVQSPTLPLFAQKPISEFQ